MNECHFLGNLTRDIELLITSGGKKIAKGGLALHRGKSSPTTFIDFVAWEATAEFLATYFKKGDLAILHCAVQQETWEDKNSGARRSKLTFRVNRVEFVPGKRGERSERASEHVASEVGAEAEDDAIPF